MNKSESIQALATALSKFQAAVSGAAKSSDNPFYKSKYADLAELWKTVREPLTANGLSVSQPLSPTEPGFVGVETVLMHESGEWISGVVIMPLTKADPQGAGSAITYARRYGLAAILGIHQEDDDAQSHNRDAVKGKAMTKPAVPEPDPAHILQVAISGTLQNLIDQGIDKYSVKTHRDASILKHLGTKTVKECQDTNLLEIYLQHLTEKLPTTQAELEVVNE